MTTQRKVGRTRHEKINYKLEYSQLLHELHHGIRKQSCSIQGILLLELSDKEKLELISLCIDLLDRTTRQISAKHLDFNAGGRPL